MPQPPAGKVQTDLNGLRSSHNPQLVYSEQLSVTGTLTINIGTFDRFNGPGIKKSVVASLVSAPVAGASIVTAKPVAGVSNQYLISVFTSAFAASVTATLVNVVGMIGGSNLA